MEINRAGDAVRLLRAHPDVRDAAVLEKGAELLAVVRPSGYCSGADLRDLLIDAVGLEPTPPVVVVVMDQNEETERPLGSEDAATAAADSPYVYRWQPPETDVENALCAVLRDVLGRGRVSLADHFVDLGGDSMAAIRVMNELEQRCALLLPVEAFFADSIGGLAAAARPRTAAAPA